jgi:(2Fe-2S) ferredoxin
MQKPQYHLFLCSSFRTTGEPKGVCHKKGGDLMQYLQTEVGDRGIDAVVSTTGCLNVCEKGPVLIVYPNAWWYKEVDEAKVDAILDALEQGSAVEELLLT